MYKNIPDFLESVSKEHGDKTAFHIRRLFKTTKVTYSQVAEFSFKFAQYYRNVGLKKGDSIIMWAPNMPEWIR
jgi:acyl-CoA synthetase (AMP-forming)/AMP-acid ligase II